MSEINNLDNSRATWKHVEVEEAQEGVLFWAYQPGEVGRQQGKLLCVAKFAAQIQSCKGSSEGSSQEARL